MHHCVFIIKKGAYARLYTILEIVFVNFTIGSEMGDIIIHPINWYRVPWLLQCQQKMERRDDRFIQKEICQY